MSFIGMKATSNLILRRYASNTSPDRESASATTLTLLRFHFANHSPPLWMRTGIDEDTDSKSAAA
jgi:hypothetical protein